MINPRDLLLDPWGTDEVDDVDEAPVPLADVLAPPKAKVMDANDVVRSGGKLVPKGAPVARIMIDLEVWDKETKSTILNPRIYL